MTMPKWLVVLADIVGTLLSLACLIGLVMIQHDTRDENLGYDCYSTLYNYNIEAYLCMRV